MTIRFNVKRLACVLLSSLILTSCAKTVTLKEEAGTEITFQIMFESAPNFNQYKYYIIFNTSTFLLNTNLTDNYFFIPGETFLETPLDIASGGAGLDYFYSNYFYSWGSVLTLKENDITLTGGPFANELTSGNEDAEHFNYTSNLLAISNYNINNNVISFTLPLSDINIDDTVLYFSIVTSKGDDINNTQDLVSTIQFVELISNSPPTTGYNTSIFTPDESAKIVSWTVTVQ